MQELNSVEIRNQKKAFIKEVSVTLNSCKVTKYPRGGSLCENSIQSPRYITFLLSILATRCCEDKSAYCLTRLLQDREQGQPSLQKEL